MNKYVFDTNALLDFSDLLHIEGQKIIPYVVLRELDHLKVGINETAFKARQAVRILKKTDIYYDSRFDAQENYFNDDVIIKCAKDHDANLISGDFLVQIKAKSQGIDCVETNGIVSIDSKLEYTGMKEVYLDPSDQEDSKTLANIYQSEGNPLNMFTNQYLIIWDKASPSYDSNGNIKGYEVIDKLKFNGEKLIKIKYKNIDNMFMGKIKPLNVKQELLFDMLQDKSSTIKTTFGGFGVGKDFLMISHAIELLQHQKIEKLIWVRNNIEVRDSNPIGFLPSDMESKLLPFAMPLADHLGGLDGLEAYLRQEKIEIQHLGFMRGRDIKNSIIYVSECENNTRQHIQLLIGRVGSGSQLWLNGDTKQVDHDKFTVNNGVNALKLLQGQKLYGQVTLDKTERSETAKLADILNQ